MLRAVFTDSLPKRKFRGKLQIYWDKCIGHKVKFIYDDLHGEFEILNYHKNGQLLEILYKNETQMIQTGNFTSNGIRGIINKILYYPSLVELLWDAEDAKKYTISSNKKIDFKCPNCGSRIKNKTINNVKNRGLKCDYCSDSKSYPEKFLYNILKQTGLEFESQKTFEWSKVYSCENPKLNGYKRYDFYIPELNCIIETHGGQHYYEGFESIAFKSFEEEKENDILKEKLAQENGITHYIIIDCRKSDLNYIRNSVLKSDLFKLFALERIDWLKCHELASGSLVKTVCDMWKLRQEIVEISLALKLHEQTVRKYLRRGVELKLCDYNSDAQLEKRNKKLAMLNKINNSKQVVQLNMSGNYIRSWGSLANVKRDLGISATSISYVCKKKDGYKSAGGFKWMYREDYDNSSKIK